MLMLSLRDFSLELAAFMLGITHKAELKGTQIDTCMQDIDGDVDIYDMVVATGNYGKSW